MKTAYFILGMHRSGTSALGGVLDIMGLEFGSDLMKANKENPKGYYENNYIYKCNKKILSENNSSWDDLHFDVSMIPAEKKRVYIEEAKEILYKEFRFSKQFAIKDPRICLLFPIWEQACKELGIDIKVILPYRNPMEVARSLQKRNQFSVEKGLLLWSKHFLFAEYYSREYKRTFISFDDLVFQTDKSIDRLYDFMQAKGQKKKKEIHEFLDKDIKHNNIPIDNFTEEIPHFLRKLIKALQKRNFNDHILFDHIRDDFKYILKFLSFSPQEERELNERRIEVQLLGRIKDIAFFDEEYYIKRYSDVKNKFRGEPSHHYFLYGKKEGRKPNEYCEKYEIDTKEITARDEEIFLFHQEIEKIQEENSKISDLLESQKEALEEAKKIEQTLTSKLKETEQQKQRVEQSLQEKIDSIEEEKRRIEQTLTSKLKETEQQKQRVEQSLHEKIDSIEEEKRRIEQTLTNKLKEIEQQKQRIEQSLQEKIKKSEKLIIEKEKEITKLNQTIDEVIQELIVLKESKSWIYTRPLCKWYKKIKG